MVMNKMNHFIVLGDSRAMLLDSDASSDTFSLTSFSWWAIVFIFDSTLSHCGNKISFKSYIISTTTLCASTGELTSSQKELRRREWHGWVCGGWWQGRRQLFGCFPVEVALNENLSPMAGFAPHEPIPLVKCYSNMHVRMRKICKTWIKQIPNKKVCVPSRLNHWTTRESNKISQQCQDEDHNPFRVHILQTWVLEKVSSVFTGGGWSWIESKATGVRRDGGRANHSDLAATHPSLTVWVPPSISGHLFFHLSVHLSSKLLDGCCLLCTQRHVNAHRKKKKEAICCKMNQRSNKSVFASPHCGSFV